MNCRGLISEDRDCLCGDTDVNGYVDTCHNCKDDLIVRMFNLARFNGPLSDCDNKFIAGAMTDQCEDLHNSLK